MLKAEATGLQEEEEEEEAEAEAAEWLCDVDGKAFPIGPEASSSSSAADLATLRRLHVWRT